MLNLRLDTGKPTPYSPLQGFECAITDLDSPYSWNLNIEPGRSVVRFSYSDSKLPKFVPTLPEFQPPAEPIKDENYYQADLKVIGFSPEAKLTNTPQPLKGFDCIVQLNGVNFPVTSLSISSEGDLPVKVTLEFCPSSLDISLDGLQVDRIYPHEVTPHTSPSALFLGLRVPLYLYGFHG